MKITDSARDIILKTMIKQGLDPKIWFIGFVFQKDSPIDFGFTDVESDNVIEFGDLQCTYKGDLMDLSIDFLEIDGRKGLVFQTS